MDNRVRANVQCFQCKKFGHIKVECQKSIKKVEKEASLVAEELESNNLFMASSVAVEASSSVWLVDSGCSNNMMGEKRLFTNLDKSHKVTICLGNDKEMEVPGLRIVTISTKNGELKQLHGVQLLLGLAYNLLNVGQLLTKGYSIIF